MPWRLEVPQAPDMRAMHRHGEERTVPLGGLSPNMRRAVDVAIAETDATGAPAATADEPRGRSPALTRLACGRCGPEGRPPYEAAVRGVGRFMRSCRCVFHHASLRALAAILLDHAPRL